MPDTNEPAQRSTRQRRAGPVLVLCAALLAGCAHPPRAQVPVSGVSGSDGGADATQYYDRRGNPHFEN